MPWLAGYLADYAMHLPNKTGKGQADLLTGNTAPQGLGNQLESDESARFNPHPRVNKSVDQIDQDYHEH